MSFFDFIIDLLWGASEIYFLSKEDKDEHRDKPAEPMAFRDSEHAENANRRSRDEFAEREKIDR
jgi:hypothetical protein